MIGRLILIFFSSIVLSGCLPSIGKPGGEKPVSPGEFAKGRIVKGFPSLPRYPNSVVVESVAFGDSYGASFISKDDLEKVLAFYTDSLSQLGWESQLVGRSESNYQLNVKNAQNEGTIIVNTAADGRSTAVTYAASPR